MPSSESGIPSRLEKTAALAALGFAILHTVFDIQVNHPGAALPDEFAGIQYLQQWREGSALPLAFFKGSLHRFAMAISGAWGMPSLFRLHLPTLFAFLVESWALYVLTRRFFSERAACWALIVNAVAAFTLLRLRSLLSYSVAPAELLAMMALIPSLRRHGLAAVWGMAASLLLFDYEVMALALPLLALAWSAHAPHERPHWLPAIGGALLGLACVTWLSQAEWGDYLRVRSSQSLGGNPLLHLAAGLKGFFAGAKTLPYTGISHWPAFPVACTAAAALGALLSSRRRWILFWLLLGLLPLATVNGAAEPQRAILAWPALCMLAASGLARFAPRFPKAAMVPGLLLLATFVLDLRQLHASLSSANHSTYAYSARLRNFAASLAEKSPSRVITELDSESAAALRFFLDEAGVKMGSGPAAVLWPWAQGGTMEQPGPAEIRRWALVEDDLGALWRTLPRFQPAQSRQLALHWLLKHPKADPYAKARVYEQIVGQSIMLGEFPVDLLKMLEKDTVTETWCFEWAAERAQGHDPEWAARLRRRAEIARGVK